MTVLDEDFAASHTIKFKLWALHSTKNAPELIPLIHFALQNEYFSCLLHYHIINLDNLIYPGMLLSDVSEKFLLKLRRLFFVRQQI